MPPGLFELVGVAGVIGTIAILITLAIVYVVKAAVDVWKRRQLVEIDIDATQHNIERLEITSDDRYKELVVKYDLRVEDLREARANVSSLGEAKTAVEANLRRAVDDNKKLEGERDDARTERDEAKRAAEQATADCVALAEDYEARLQAQRNQNVISMSMYQKRITRLKKWIRRRGRDTKGCRDPC